MFKTAKLTAEQIKLLSPDLQEQYQLLKTDTEGFDQDYYGNNLQENDELLIQLIQKELNALKKEDVPKKVDPPKEVAKTYKVGDTFYRANGTEITITAIKPRGKANMYKMSDTGKFIKEASVDQLLKEKPKVAPVKKEKPKTANPPKPANLPKEITWTQKLPKAQYEPLENVINKQTFKKYTATEPIIVQVKMKANPGDVILINEDGYPTKVMTAKMAEEYLVKGVFSDTYIRTETAKEKDAKIELLEKEVEKITGKKNRAEELFVRSNAAKRAARTRKKNAIPNKKTTPPKPKPKSTTKTTPAKKTTVPKNRGCFPEEYKAAEIVAIVINFLESNAAEFHSIWSGKYWSKQDEIDGIFQTKGDNPKIIVRIKKHSITNFSSPEHWYSLCLESWKLTKITTPQKGTYVRVIPKAKLKEIYTTKGEKQWMKCLKLYAEVIKCQMDGNCSAADKQKWKTIYENCGNLGKKLQVLPDRMRVLHKRARVIRGKKPGLAYSEAISRAAVELKGEEGK